MTIPMNLPTLGSTGVVQNPGDIGALGNALSGLPAIIQANMQLEAQKQRDAQNQLYLQAQMDQMRFQQEEANRRTQQAQAEAEAAGQFLGQITRPDVPVGGGLMPFQFDLPAMSPERAIQDVRPDLRSAVLESTKDTIKTVREEREKKRGEQEQAKMARAVDRFVANPDDLPAILRTVPPSQVDAFVDQVSRLKPDKGSWVIEQIGPDRRLMAFNLERNVSRDLGVNAPKPVGNITTINMPSETERRAGAMFGGAVQALEELTMLRSGGYDPLKESWFSKGAGTAGMRKVQYAALSSEGKQYYNSVYRALSNYLYAVSGAAQSPSEIQNQAGQLAAAMFDDPATLQQKERFLLGKVEELGQMGGRAVPGTSKLPRSWDDLTKLSQPTAVNPYR